MIGKPVRGGERGAAFVEAILVIVFLMCAVIIGIQGCLIIYQRAILGDALDTAADTISRSEDPYEYTDESVRAVIAARIFDDATKLGSLMPRPAIPADALTITPCMSADGTYRLRVELVSEIACPVCAVFPVSGSNSNIHFRDIVIRSLENQNALLDSSPPYTVEAQQLAEHLCEDVP